MDLKIGEQTVKVWKFPSEYDVEGFYLLYGTDEAGKTAFYIYDETEGTVITAPDGILSAGQENEISQVQLDVYKRQVLAEAKKEREAGIQVLVSNMNKNKKFQKEQLQNCLLYTSRCV